MNLPLDFENRMKDYLGGEMEDFLASYSKPEIKSLRINKTLDTGLFEKIFGEENGNTTKPESVKWEPSGFYYDSDSAAPGKSPLHEAGAYYIQEASAMAPVRALNVKPGERVLDLCASPGGKSTQIASYLDGQGILISNEIVPKRAKILSENIERMGIGNALVISEDPRDLSEKLQGYFDKILVDAPCSGEGMFRRSETAVNEWSSDNVKMCAKRQEWILDEAYKMLAPSGRLVYSTCTFSKEENEQNSLNFVKRHSDMKIVAVDSNFSFSEQSPANEKISDDFINNNDSENTGDAIKNTGIQPGYEGVGYRLWPHKVMGEGHYFCVFEKQGNDSSLKAMPLFGYEKGISNKEKNDLKEMKEFLVNNIISSDKITDRIIVKFGDRIYAVPKECPNLKGLKVLRPGLNIGMINKNRFEPAHALAMYLKKGEFSKCYNISLDNDVIYKYYRGETFNVDSKDSGWYLVMVEGISAGWGKMTNGVMKNHYPKGLRKSF